MKEEKKSIETLEDNTERNEAMVNDKIKENNSNKNNKKERNKKIILLILSMTIILIVTVTIIFKDKLFKGNVGNKEPESSLKEEKNEEAIKEILANYKMAGNGLQDIDLKFLQLEMNNKNIVYSPLSIKYALGMLNEGTGGNSKDQINTLIGDYKFRTYTNSANMSFANAMFIRNSYKNNINVNYINNLKTKYNAEVIYDDFNSPNNINKWVSNNTFKLVDNLVDDVTDSDFFLINALAIDMEWNKRIQATVETYQDQYDVEYAHEDYFDYVNIRDMEGSEVIKFNNQDNVDASIIGASINNYDIVNDKGRENIKQFISKEYQKWVEENPCGNEYNEPVDTYVEKYIEELDSNYKKVEASTDFRFYIDNDVKVFAKELKKYNDTTLEYIGIMPTNNSLNDFVKKTNAEEINKLINSLKEVKLENFEKGKITRITGGIPLFKYEYQLDLMKDLNKIGVTDVFDSNEADLSGLTNEEGSHIDQVAHKANIEFSNEGIKAAAATQEGGAGASFCGFEYLYDVPVVTIDLTFDKPFLYLIRDKDSGEVWFVGSVFNPIKNTNEYARVFNADNN